MKQLSHDAKSSGHSANRKANLQEIQEFMARAIMSPLTSSQHMQRLAEDGSDMRQLSSRFIKPNQRLTSFERLEIYNRQYWFRVIDSLYEDFPGLLAVLGEKKFEALITAYLAQYPSNSFTMRNLGERLPQFILEESHLTSPREKLALDMARLEWAQVVAFDGEAKPPLHQTDIARCQAEELKLQLQPYITPLQLSYPLDNFDLARKKVGRQSTEASTCRQHGQRSRVPIPEPRRVHLVVHRFNNSIYFKRLQPAAFKLITALHRGDSLGEACGKAFARQLTNTDGANRCSKMLSEWFATWTELQWFCAADAQVGYSDSQRRDAEM